MKRRDWGFVAVLVLYCMLIAYFTIHPLAIFAEESRVNVPRQAVKAATTYRFPVITDAPDPNELLKFVNQERINSGLSPLQADEELSAIAWKRATDMVDRQYYAHKDPDGKYYYDLMAATGKTLQYSCENLDLTESTDLKSVVHDWLTSTKGHRECLLNPTPTTAGFVITKLANLNANGVPQTAYIAIVILAQG